MAVFDTYRAFQALTAAGFSERQARALIDVGSEVYGGLATKVDIAGMATKANVRALEQATKADTQGLRQATKVDFRDLSCACGCTWARTWQLRPPGLSRYWASCRRCSPASSSRAFREFLHV